MSLHWYVSLKYLQNRVGQQLRQQLLDVVTENAVCALLQKVTADDEM
jgi:hypothetical protein